MRLCPGAAPAARLLALRTLRVVSRRGAVRVASVLCPCRGRIVALEECGPCADRGAIRRDAFARADHLECRFVAPHGDAPRRRATLADLLTLETVALRADVPCAVAAAALGERTAAAVVDGDGRPIGTVSEGGLLRAGAGAVVGDAMSRVVVVVSDAASAAIAAALISAQRRDHLLVVSGEGLLVGVLSALELVASLATGDASG